MSPIESVNDIRLVTLIDIVMNLCEEIAMYRDNEPTHVLAEELFRSYKATVETGELKPLNRMKKHFPLLDEAIK